jgi:sporulation protein YlmC with PRC-barrel domain
VGPYPAKLKRRSDYRGKQILFASDQTDSTSRSGILRDLDTFIGYSVIATDGEVGRVCNLLFDDHSWTVRYLVIAPENWTKRREVELALAVVEQSHWIYRSFKVHCTRDQVLNSPELNSARWVALQRTVCMQEGSRVVDRWLNSGFYEESMMPHSPGHAVRAMISPRLRSTRELLDYRLWARDGEIGRLHRFFVDDNTWHLRYLDVKAGSWINRQSVLIPTRSVESISETDRRVNLRHNREQI